MAFPLTRVSVLERTQSVDPDVRARAHETLAAVYWGPVYAYVRLAHGAAREDAEDLTQGFFAEAMRRDLFARYAAGRARFRTYLRACVDAFVANERKAQRRLKRGGGTRTVRRRRRDAGSLGQALLLADHASRKRPRRDRRLRDTAAFAEANGGRVGAAVSRAPSLPSAPPQSPRRPPRGTGAAGGRTSSRARSRPRRPRSRAAR